MVRFKEFISEAKQVGDLYHYTSYENAPKILKADSLQIGKTGHISLTRNKNLHMQSTTGLGGTRVRLTIDGDKLSEKYKIRPYKYHSMDVDAGDESEENISRRHIDNLRDYVKDVHVDHNKFS
jgi:hypothetical protein